jgi:single-strand DNA-binding protein
MNKVLLLGRIATEPELKHTTEKGTAYLKFILAVDNEYTSNKGEKSTDFVRIAVWGKRAESLLESLQKGRLVNVIGRISTGSYEDMEGNKKYFTEVAAEQINFLDNKKQRKNQDNGDIESAV